MVHLTYQERKVLLFVAFLLALGFLLSYLNKTTGCNFCFIQLYSDKSGQRAIDINTANRVELIALPGIGEKTADKILALRAEKNGFKSLDELGKIKGLNSAKLDRLKDYLKVVTSEPEGKN